MSGLRPIPARRLLPVLVGCGFRLVSQKGSHLKLQRSDGRIVIVPMHAAKPLKIGLLRAILRDADLTVEQFLGLL